jgi:hypothetical protein
MVKSYIYGVQGIMDFMGIENSTHTAHIDRLQVSDKNVQLKKIVFLFKFPSFQGKGHPLPQAIG